MRDRGLARAWYAIAALALALLFIVPAGAVGQGGGTTPTAPTSFPYHGTPVVPKVVGAQGAQGPNVPTSEFGLSPAIIGDVSTVASWSSYSWSTMNSTVTEYEVGSGIAPTRKVNATGWESISYTPTDSATSCGDIALPMSFNLFNGTEVRFNVTVTKTNTTSTNNGQSFVVGFVKTDAWSTSVSPSYYCASPDSITRIAISYFSEEKARNETSQSFIFNGTTSEGQQPITRGAPIGMNSSTSVYGIADSFGEAAGGRQYETAQLWNFSKSQNPVAPVNMSESIQASTGNKWRMILDFYDPLPAGPNNYYNVSISPILVATNLSADGNAPKPFLPKSAWTFDPTTVYQDPTAGTLHTFNPSVVRVGTEWLMAYAATSPCVHVALAESTNEYSWSYVGNITSTCGSEKPSIALLQNGTLEAWWDDGRNIYEAWSTDTGAKWTAATTAIVGPGWASGYFASPSVLKDISVGAPISVGGRYWLSFYGENTSSPSGKVGLAWSDNLITWTLLSSPVIVPNPLAPSAYIASSYGTSELVPWNGSVYMLIDGQPAYPTTPNEEDSIFAVFLARATNIAGYSGTDMGNWTVYPAPVFTKSPPANTTAPDYNQFYTGALTLNRAGALVFLYSGEDSNGYERITEANLTVGASPTEESSYAHVGFNWVDPLNRSVGWAYSSATSAMAGTVSGSGTLSINVSSGGTSLPNYSNDTFNSTASETVACKTTAFVYPGQAHKWEYAYACLSGTRMFVGVNSSRAPPVTLSFSVPIPNAQYEVYLQPSGSNTSYPVEQATSSTDPSVNVTYTPSTEPLSSLFYVAYVGPSLTGAAPCDSVCEHINLELVLAGVGTIFAIALAVIILGNERKSRGGGRRI